MARKHAALGVLVAFAIGLIFWLFAPWIERPPPFHVAFAATRPYFEAVGAIYEEQTGKAAPQRLYAGSIEQAEVLAEGFVADSVMLSSPAQLDGLARRGQVNETWREALPFGASPFTTTIVLVVRAENPTSIQDWKDLTRPEVRLMLPSPATSGAGAHAYLALWYYFRTVEGSDEAATLAGIDRILQHTQLVALNTPTALERFVREAATDVIPVWESTAREFLRVNGDEKFILVYPSIHLIATPVVANLDRYIRQRDTSNLIDPFLHFLFTPEAQKLAAIHHWRPREPEATAFANPAFPPLNGITLEEAFGSESAAWERHFGRDGTFSTLLRWRAARLGGIE